MILDTDVLSAMSARHCPAQLAERLTDARGAIYTTAVNWAEVCYGIARRPTGEGTRLRERYEELVLPLLDILHFDEASAELYANLRVGLERRGERLPDADLMVASIALRHEMTLVSGNTRHFARIPGLKVENWLEE
jgi:tRNA(fMet)-specific endonuclease VapC